jgi:hypothetical protein
LPDAPDSSPEKDIPCSGDENLLNIHGPVRVCIRTVRNSLGLCVLARQFLVAQGAIRHIRVIRDVITGWGGRDLEHPPQ